VNVILIDFVTVISEYLIFATLFGESLAYSIVPSDM
jgi:hypothetical protein